MAANFDFNRSSLIVEQYQREMEIIDAALQDESQDEYEERLSLVSCSWSLSCACFHGNAVSVDEPVPVPVAFANSYK
jgi:hypothetical protein